MKTKELFYETLLPLSSKGERDTLFKSLIADEISRLFEEFFSKDEYLRAYIRDNPNPNLALRPKSQLALRTSSNVYERVEDTGTVYLFDVIVDLYDTNATSNTSVHKVILNGLYVGIAVGDRCQFCVDDAIKVIELIRDNLAFFLCLNEKKYRIYNTKG